MMDTLRAFLADAADTAFATGRKKLSEAAHASRAFDSWQVTLGTALALWAALLFWARKAAAPQTHASGASSGDGTGPRAGAANGLKFWRGHRERGGLGRSRDGAGLGSGRGARKGAGKGRARRERLVLGEWERSAAFPPVGGGIGGAASLGGVSGGGGHSDDLGLTSMGLGSSSSSGGGGGGGSGGAGGSLSPNGPCRVHRSPSEDRALELDDRGASRSNSSGSGGCVPALRGVSGSDSQEADFLEVVQALNKQAKLLSCLNAPALREAARFLQRHIVLAPHEQLFGDRPAEAATNAANAASGDASSSSFVSGGAADGSLYFVRKGSVILRIASPSSGGDSGGGAAVAGATLRRGDTVTSLLCVLASLSDPAAAPPGRETTDADTAGLAVGATAGAGSGLGSAVGFGEGSGAGSLVARVARGVSAIAGPQGCTVWRLPPTALRHLSRKFPTDALRLTKVRSIMAPRVILMIILVDGWRACCANLYLPVGIQLIRALVQSPFKLSIRR